MTLENIVNIVNGASAALKGTLAAGLLAGGVYSKDVNAQEPSWLSGSVPGSVCSERYDTLFSSGSEDLTQITPIGLQDCATLENHFDDNLEDSNPLVVSLDGDQSYTLATLRSLSDQSTRGDYTAVLADGGPLPSWMSFDSEYGVLSASPSCDDQGSHLLEQNVAPGDGPGSINPLFVNYEVSCPSTLSVAGLDFEGDDQVTSWPYHGTWGDSDNDGVIDQPVVVREGKGSPYEAWVRTDKSSVSLEARSALPSYVSLVGDRIDFHPPLGAEGDSGTLELEVCDSASPSDCRDLDVPYQVVDRLPNIVGLSYTAQNGTIDNPVDGSFFEFPNEVACTANADERFVVTQYYDVDQNYAIINHPIDIMGINSSTGGILTNPSCPSDIGRDEFPSVRVMSNSGSSGYQTAEYVITNGVTQQSVPVKSPNYK